jgi:hypothetical protein
MTKVLGPKTVSVPASNILDVDFTYADFNAALGYPEIDSSFSLAVDITNNMVSPIFFGIVLETQEQIVTVADAIHIGFVAANSRAVVSGRSVSPLANIRGTVKKITVKLYAFSDTTAERSVIVSLRISAPILPSSLDKPKGRDTIVDRPSVFQSYEDTFSMVTGTASALIVETGALASEFRLQINCITVGMEPTPYPGDTLIFAQITRASGSVFRITEFRSITTEYLMDRYTVPIIINIGDNLQVYGTNFNAGVTVAGKVDIFGEFLY